MKTSDFDFNLPESQIAQFPLNNRTDSKLLVLGSNGEMQHTHFKNIIDFLNPGDLLIFNNSRVMNARFYGNKTTGGKVEILIERILDDSLLAHVKTSKTLKIGARITIANGVQFEMLGRLGALFQLKLISDENIQSVMEKHGHVPLPPYIDRPDEHADIERYQTVYAQPLGSVAAPTAGLHFDHDLLQQIQQKGINTEYVTLHVGAGTFQPVKVDDVAHHHMHSEYIEVPERVVNAIQKTHQLGKKVIAVGTTSVRSLETASLKGKIEPYFGDTDIFIYPGFNFKTVDGIITNFHLPQSTLIMLVAAFSGKYTVMRAYKTAVEKQYRFFSYGDAMFLQSKHLSSSQIDSSTLK